MIFGSGHLFDFGMASLPKPSLPRGPQLASETATGLGDPKWPHGTPEIPGGGHFDFGRGEGHF